MKKKFIITFILSLLLGCVSNGKISTIPVIKTTTRNSSPKIELPPNHIIVESDRPIKTDVIFVREKYNPRILAHAYKNDELDRFEDKEISQKEKADIESNLALLEHLNLTGKSAKDAEMEFEADKSHDSTYTQSKLDNEIKDPIEVIIALVLKQTSDLQKNSDREDMALYSCTIVYQLIVLDDDYPLLSDRNCKVEGLAKRYRIWALHWDSSKREYIKTFKQGEETDEALENNKQARNQAFCRAVFQLVNALGTLLPCGSLVDQIDLKRNEAKIMAGAKEGIQNAQIFVIYEKIEESAIPLALAEARTHNMLTKTKSDFQTTALKIFKWSYTDSAIEIKKKIKENHDHYVSSKHELYAASIGMPEILGECDY